jgi:hypothetical protein
VTDDLGYGPRLSAKEFEKRIVALYSGMPPNPSKQVEQEVHRREFDLTVDHRLGIGFPKDRREALWEIQQRIERKRIRLAFAWLLHVFSYKPLYGRANKLAAYMVREYAQVLSPNELEAFFELREGEQPVLPIDKLI